MELSETLEHLDEIQETHPKIKYHVMSEGKGTKKTRGINTILCNKFIIPIATKESGSDLIIKFQVALRMAAKRIRKKTNISLI